MRGVVYWYFQYANPHFKYYKTKSDAAAWTGLFVGVGRQLFIKSNASVYNTFVRFIFTFWRWQELVETSCHNKVYSIISCMWRYVNHFLYKLTGW